MTTQSQSIGPELLRLGLLLAGAAVAITVVLPFVLALAATAGR